MPRAPEDPLLSCLLTLSRHYGRTATSEALTAGLPLRDGWLTPALFARAASRVGLTARVTPVALSALDPVLMPAVLLLEGGTACVLLQRDGHSGSVDVLMSDLPDASVTLSADDIAQRYIGSAILCRPKFQFDQRVAAAASTDRGHWFWSAVRENFPVYRDVLLAALLINIFALAVPLFTMNVYDRVVPNFAVETLWMLAAGVAIVLVSDMLLRNLRSYFIDIASRRIDVRLSALIMETVLGMRLEHRPRAVGSFAASLRSFETVRDFMTSASVTTLIDIPFALLFIAVVAWIAAPVLIPIVAGVLIVVLYGLLIRRRLRALAESAYRSAGLRSAGLIESLTGLETIKAVGAEGRMQSAWEETTAFLSQVSVQLRLLGNTAINFTQFAQQVVVVLVIATGVYLIADKALTMGGLIACTMLASRIMAPFGQLAGLITQYHSAAVAMEGLERVMALPQERPEARHFLPLEHLRGAVEFRKVSFSYPGSEQESVSELSFSVEPGERIAILGRVGSGKSTLLKLIMGLYQPTAGAVLVDNIDLRQLDPAALRLAAGYVPQDTTLFFGTLRDNLKLSHREIDDEALLGALEIAGLGDFVRRHPRGLDLPVGERGETLSGGQRKSVALARALVHEPPLVLLDEPTGSMDHSTEIAVREALDAATQGRTVLIVTHRMALLQMVDRILVMDNGRLVADGPRVQVIEALQKGRIGKAS